MLSNCTEVSGDTVTSLENHIYGITKPICRFSYNPKEKINIKKTKIALVQTNVNLHEIKTNNFLT